MSLKELTLDNHKKAERSKFAKILLSGEIDPLLYYAYLSNQVHVYSALEQRVPMEMLGIGQVARTSLISQDIKELEKEHGFTGIMVPTMPSVVQYQQHLLRIEKDNPRGLLAHLYVRHFGDMFGGSIIAKKVPGSGAMYVFENKENLIVRVRNLLDDDMAVEANSCFTYAIKLFEELSDWYDRKNSTK